MPPVLRVLGVPELMPDSLAAGDAPNLGGTKQRGVLVRLALAAPAPVTLDQLIDDIWGESPPETARNTIQVYVSALRKAVRPHGADVVRTGDSYALSPGPVEVDAARFAELVATGRSAMRAGALDRAVDALLAADAVWQPPPLAGLAELPFVGPTRTALEATWAGAAGDLADALIRLGRQDEAADVARSVVAASPYAEHGWVLLATAQYHRGQQVEALATCRRIRDLLADELGLDPGPELTEIEQAIRTQTLRPAVAAAASAPAADTALPALPSHLVGRDRLITAVLTAMRDGAPLVSLVGLGGIGKTTTSLAVAHALRDAGSTTAFCELEAARDATTALELACRALGRDPGNDPAAALAALDAPTRPVLVLDNAEHLPDLPAALAVVLRGERHPQLLVTSRRPLDLASERVVQVPPLALENDDGTPGPAVDLFLQRAGESRSDLDLTKSTPAAQQLCTMLEGVPLAIELAAKRSRVLTPDQLLDRIGRRKVSLLDLEATPDRPDRHASLRAVLESTESMLSPAARRLLQVVACCDGWVTLDLVEAAAEPVVEDDVVDALDELVSVDLVHLDGDGWLRLRAPVRQHSLERPAAELAETSSHVRAAVLSLVESTAPTLHGSTTAAGLDRLTRDYDTISATLTKAVDDCDDDLGARLALGLNRFWLMTGRLAEGRRRIAAVRSLSHERENAIRLALLDGTFASYLNAPEATSNLTRALAQVTESALPPDRLVVNAWCCLAATQAHQGDLAAAETSAREAAELAATSGDPALVALARDLDGHIASYAGDFERALAATLAGIEDARRSGDRYDLIQLLVSTSDELLRLGRPADARLLVEEAFELAGETEVGPLLAYVLAVRGQTAAVNGETAAARGYLSEVLRLAPDSYPDPLVQADALCMLAALAAESGDLTAAARWWGASDVLYSDHAAAATERLVPLFRERRKDAEETLGDQFRLLAALGAADPARTVQQAASADRLLEGARA
jgi:predicted ATPase/DNA-binding SARP family transcriptional activator